MKWVEKNMNDPQSSSRYLSRHLTRHHRCIYTAVCLLTVSELIVAIMAAAAPPAGVFTEQHQDQTFDLLFCILTKSWTCRRPTRSHQECDWCKIKYSYLTKLQNLMLSPKRVLHDLKNSHMTYTFWVSAEWTQNLEYSLMRQDGPIHYNGQDWSRQMDESMTLQRGGAKQEITEWP